MRHRSYLPVRSTLIAMLLGVLAGCGSAASVPSPAPSTIPSALPSAVDGATASAAPSGLPAASSDGSSAPAASAAGNPSTIAVQTVVSYYRAINDKNFETAYALWADAGAASGQSIEQFRAGFADTVQTSLVLGASATPNQSTPDRIDVPVTIMAVVNDPGVPHLGQKVQHFAGTYAVSIQNGRGAIVGANVKEDAAAEAPPAPFGDPAQLLHAYYDAINARDFAAAYTDWSGIGSASQQEYAQFVQGFAETSAVTIQLGVPQSEGAAGSVYVTLPTLVVATQKDGSQRSYCGSYTLRWLNVPPFDQLGLRIERAEIAPIDLIELDSDQATLLLTHNCQR